MVYNIFFSNDSGANWFPVDLDIHEESCTVDFSFLQKDDYLLRVIATDGWNTGEDTVNFAIKKSKNGNMVLYLVFLEQLFEHFPILEQLLQSIYDKLADL